MEKKRILITMIFVCIIIVIFYFTPTTESFEKEDSTRIEIVVARYKEDLKWLNDEPFNKYDVIIYNKGDDEDFAKSDKIKKVVKLPNLGRDAQTYFYHIINNYDDLAKVTVFLPGSIGLDYKYNRAKDVIYNIEKTNETTIHCNDITDNSLDDFQLDSWISSDPSNMKANKDKTMLKSDIRPYGEWIKHYFPNGEKNTCIAWHVLSGISNEHIWRKPVSYYEQFYNQVAGHNNPETGHYIERAWDAIFHPLDNSNKIH